MHSMVLGLGPVCGKSVASIEVGERTAPPTGAFIFLVAMFQYSS